MGTKIEELRNVLQRQGRDEKVAGNAGEELTRRLLDGAGVPWMFVEQGETTKSPALAMEGAKRIDFMIAVNGTSTLLDAKCLTSAAHGGSLTFELDAEEIRRIRRTGALFGVDVAVIVWDRRRQRSAYVLDDLSRFVAPSTDEPGARWRGIFAAEEMVEVALF